MREVQHVVDHDIQTTEKLSGLLWESVEEILVYVAQEFARLCELARSSRQTETGLYHEVLSELKDHGKWKSKEVSVILPQLNSSGSLRRLFIDRRCQKTMTGTLFASTHCKHKKAL